MKEIRVFENEDGTYNIEIIQNVTEQEMDGRYEITKETESKTTIEGVLIETLGLTPEQDGVLIKLSIKD